jgi:hypothetical protein
MVMTSAHGQVFSEQLSHFGRLDQGMFMFHRRAHHGLLLATAIRRQNNRDNDFLKADVRAEEFWKTVLDLLRYNYMNLVVMLVVLLIMTIMMLVVNTLCMPKAGKSEAC